MNKKSDKDKKTSYLQMYMSSELKEKLKKLSAKEKISLAEWIRRQIEDAEEAEKKV